MAIKTKEILKSYFETGDRPTQSQFADLIDSLAHVNTIGESTQNYIRFKKDNTITEEHLGRLAMHKKEPVSVEGDIVLAIQPTAFMLTLDNVTGSGFAYEEVINQGTATGILMGMFPVGEDLWFALINVTNGTFQSGQPIENEAETVSANVLSVLPNLPETGNNVLLYGGDNPTALATVTGVSGYNVTVETVVIFGDITETESILVQGEVDSPPVIFGAVDIENTTFPETTGGEDLATLCQTTPMTEGTKMEFDLKIKGIINADRPTTKVMRINFNEDNIQDGQGINIKEGESTLAMTIIFKDTATELNEVQIGATLEDTIDNLQAFLEEDEEINTYFKFAGRDGTASIDIELLKGYIENTPTWNVGSNDGKPFAGYRIDTEIFGELGDGEGEGFATYSVVRELGNAQSASDIANTNISGKIVNYTQSVPSQTYGFLLFQLIYTWSELTPEEMGLVWFDNGEDFKDAVVAALENSYEDLFNANFEIVSSTWSSDTDEAVIRIRKKVSFNAIMYYSFNTFSPDNANKEVTVQTVIYPTLTIPKMVRNMVLGEIVGIDGEDVLIDRSFLHKTILAGEEEGLAVNAVDVYNINVQGLANEVHAWDNGKVINLVNLYEAIGSNPTALNNMRAKSILLGSAFIPLSSGNGNTTGKQSIIVSRNSPITNQTN